MLQFKDNITPSSNELIPTHGCGKTICFEETDYTIDAGEKSVLAIYYDGTITPLDGTVLYIMGSKFKISYTDNNTPSEIFALPTASNIDWLTAIINAANKRTEFDDFDFSFGTDHIKITSKVESFHPENDQTDLNSSITGFERGAANSIPETNGVNPTYKENYYVFIEIKDNRTEEVICANDFEVPLNVYPDGSNMACFELSQIIKQLPQVYITPPDFNDPEYFDDVNQINYYSIKAYAKYKDPDDTTGCGSIQTNLLSLGSLNKFGLPFFEFIQQTNSYLDLEDIYDGELFMTDLPNDYKICRQTPFYLRFHRRIHQLNGTAYNMFLVMSLFYTDGTVDNLNQQIEELALVPNTTDWDKSEIHVINVNKLINDATKFDQTKTPSRLVVSVYYSNGVLPQGQATEFKTIYFDTASRCCDCLNTFLFASPMGNNDTIIGSCDNVFSLDVEFGSTCTTQECGEYLGGKTAISPNVSSLAKTTWLYVDDYEYLIKFLRSPKKYLYKDTHYVEILPVDTSYEVYNKNKKGRLKFTYIESTILKQY